MKVLQLTITRCYECPYMNYSVDYDKYCCEHPFVVVKQVKDKHIIPDWCPLADEVENKQFNKENK